MRVTTLLAGIARRALLLSLLPVFSARATETPPSVGPLDLEGAVQFAIEHHPAMQVQTATEELRREEVSTARAGYLPNLDLSAQLNAGTGNVLRGSLFPMPEIPNVSGPPTGRDFSDAALGSAIGVGVGWDVLGLLRQMAQVDATLADESQTHAATDVARLTVGFAAADQFLDVLVRVQVTRAARVAVERARVFATTVKPLVDQELRPGADYSRATAEEAVASTELIRAEQAESLSRVALARTLGVVGTEVQINPGRLVEVETRMPPPGAIKSPELVAAELAIRANEAKKHAVDLQYLPRLDLVGALWLRGSGLTSGTLGPSPGSGIVPDTPNWAAAVVLTWPVLELVAIHARSKAELAQVSIAQAKNAEVEQSVQSQIDSAREVLTASRRVAENTPIALRAAQDADRQATARYRSGLSSADAVAETERLLAQAETDDVVARLNVLRAELLLSRAVGDLTPFLTAVREGR